MEDRYRPLLIVATLLAITIFAVYVSRRRISFNQIVTLTLAASSLAVATLVYLQSLDNSDMRSAIEQIAYLGKQNYRQANAIRRQVRELTRQTGEMKLQSAALSSTAGSTFSLAGVSAAEMRQRDLQFSLEQRPIVRWDPESDASKDPLSDDKIFGSFKWNYGFKNVGKSTAYNVVMVEGISLSDGQFHENVRLVGQELGPNATGWSTAVIKVAPSQLPLNPATEPVLRVTFYYSDVLKKRWKTMFCLRFLGDGLPRDCSQEKIASSPTLSDPMVNSH